MDESPVEGEYGLTMELKEIYIGVDDYQFEEYFHQAAKAAGWEVDEQKGYDNSFSEEGRNALFDELESCGHWMLGWPYFTQYDPREQYDEGKHYAVQLFQMDLVYMSGRRIM